MTSGVEQSSCSQNCSKMVVTKWGEVLREVLLFQFDVCEGPVAAPLPPPPPLPRRIPS